MKIAERIVMVLILLSVILGFAWIYFSVQSEHQQVVDDVAAGKYQTPIATSTKVTLENWQTLYPNTVLIRIKDIDVQASVADSLPERIQGLSDTPFLPENVVKLFAFGVAGKHSIWMKDMNYPLDIIWLDEGGIITHIEANVSPDSYPESFTPPQPALYVIETNAGFTASNTVTVGDKVILYSGQ